MGYKIVQINQLMAYEFGKVEGDIDSLKESELISAIPFNMKFDEFANKVRRGDWAVLTDSPNTPLLIQKNDSTSHIKSWSLNSLVENSFDPVAQKSYLNRTQMKGNGVVGVGSSRNQNLHSPLPMPPYIPEPVKLERSDSPPSLDYEYCFEIACSSKSLSHTTGYQFMLEKTQDDICYGRWSEHKTIQGIRYTVRVEKNEPKKFVVGVASTPLGISPKQSVTVRPTGSYIVNESFIPVSPAVQVGGRLGFPSEGFYYHFHDGQLVQEYRIIGDKNWGFYATRSLHHFLNAERGYNVDQTSILVFWKLNGKVIKNQHLVYLSRQITREELDNLNDEWLNEHGIKLDISALLDVKHQSVVVDTVDKVQQRSESSSEMLSHTVKIDSKTGQRESWMQIAEQYGLTPKDLLSLNPDYDDDPMSLAVGDSLSIQPQGLTKVEKTAEYENPPVSPQIYNHPLNMIYKYTGRCLADTSIQAISNKSLVEDDVAIVNLFTLPAQDVDDVYLVFADKKMSIEEFAQETYSSKDNKIIDHILTSNPHLRRSFSQIIEGMPLVVSPWGHKHPDEENAIKQADDMMDEFLKLSSEEKKWFAEHHESATNALLMAATSSLDVYQGEAVSSNLYDFNLNHIIAGSGAVVAGAQVQGDKLSKQMKSFAQYSHYVAEKTKGLSGQALYSNPEYKAWRKEARIFQNEMKSILSEVGKPGYIKSIQTKRINDYLNVGKRQLYRAKDFSKTISGIEMTALYKQAMSFSKMTSTASWLVVGVGLYGNAKDIYQTCNLDGVISESCGRSTVKNVSSGVANIAAGYAIGSAIGYGLALAPVTGGLSIVLVGAGAFAWGMYGGDISNKWGGWVEEVLFD